MMTFMIHSLFTSLFFMFTVFSQQAYSISSSCLDIKESAPRRSHSFQIENYEYDIKLEASERTGHQLITNVFAIFLREVIGYESVDIYTYPDYFDTKPTLQRLAPKEVLSPSGELNPPSTTINLEVWPSQNVDLDELTREMKIEKCGHLGFPGRTLNEIVTIVK